MPPTGPPGWSPAIRLIKPTKHPKCPKCGGCLEHSECRIIKRGGCACPKEVKQ